MAKIILHIGTHKTATTALQNTLRANSRVLAEYNLVYPKVGKSHWHHGLVPNWSAMPKAYCVPGGAHIGLQKLVRDYADTDSTVFISSEEFSRITALESLGLVRQILSPFESIKVIVTLRFQWQFLQSVYLEISKKRSPMRPSQFVRNALDSGICEGLWIDYNGLLRQLETVFDPNEITVFDFENISNSPLGVIGTFLDYIGIKEFERISSHTVSKGGSNISPQPLASWMANLLSEPSVASSRLVDLASSCLTREYGQGVTTSIFTRSEYNMLFNHFAKLNSSLLPRLAEQGPSCSLIAVEAKPNTIFRDQVRSSLWIRMSKEILRIDKK
jgi:hypothetical protein